MTGEARGTNLQLIYSALIGGLLAVFSAIVVFTLFVDINSPAQNPTPWWAIVFAVGSAAVYMVAGMSLTERMPWLSGGFLFGAGFTAFYSGILTLSTKSRWAAVAAFAIMIALGVWLGWRTFGRGPAAGGSE